MREKEVNDRPSVDVELLEEALMLLIIVNGRGFFKGRMQGVCKAVIRNLDSCVANYKKDAEEE